jgi:hypothetical protein
VRFAIIDPGQLLVGARLYHDMDPNDRLSPGIPSSGPFLWEDIGVPDNQHFQDDICPKDASGNSMCRNSGYLETEDKNVSGALDERCDSASDFCEDQGWLYKLAPGSRDVDEALRIPCPNCAGNHVLDTEDANGNGYLDRFLVYGVDICTTDRAKDFPGRCTAPFPTNNNNVTYIWPEGCPQRAEQLGPFKQLTENGCPPFPKNSDGSLATVGSTGSDNSADTIIVQGGRIRLGGFALGVGFKFSF